MIEWLNQNAGAVQALAAIGTLFLTLVLVGATLWYAKSAKDQTSELRMARTSAVAPYVRLTDVEVRELNVMGTSTPGGYEKGEDYLVLQLHLENLGSGPAVRIQFHPRDLPPGVLLENPATAPNLAGGGGTGTLTLHVDGSSYPHLLSSLPSSWPAELRYQDLQERKVVTRFRLHMHRGGRSGVDLVARVDDRMQWVFDADASSRNL